MTEIFLLILTCCYLTWVLAGPTTNNDIPEWNNLLYGYNSQQCHVIPEDFGLCKNIGYTKMILPNFLQHESLAEATLSSKDWEKLTNFNCHNDTRRFLCSLYAPVCVPNEPVRKIHPCRELCLSVKKSCSPSMLTFGYKWPDILHCDKFPQKFAGLCIRGTEGSVQGDPTNKFSDSSKSLTRKGKDRSLCDCRSIFGSAGISDHYCSATTAIRAKISRLISVSSTKHMIRLHKKSKILKANSTDLPFLSLIEVPCLCDQIDKDKIRKGRWLILGIIRDRTFTLTSLTKWKKRNKDFKKTIRRLKRFEPKICGQRFRKSDRKMSGLNINGQKMKGKNKKSANNKSE